MKEMWNKRYAVDQFVYGKEPNQFFKDTLNELDSGGKILFPAEGEGRDAVYAAKMGYSALAFDISESAKNKALKFAEDERVKIEYLVGELGELNLEKVLFDAAVLVFAHFQPAARQKLHQQIGNLVKPGGYIILEGFSQNNIAYREQNPSIGGPDKKEMLFTKEIIKDDFDKFEVMLLEEKETELKEGVFHNGVGKVIRFIGKKMK
jgi:SAM-dependent methyltransferase